MCWTVVFIIHSTQTHVRTHTFALSLVDGDLEQANDRDRMLVKIEQIEFVECMCACSITYQHTVLTLDRSLCIHNTHSLSLSLLLSLSFTFRRCTDISPLRPLILTLYHSLSMYACTRWSVCNSIGVALWSVFRWLFCFLPIFLVHNCISLYGFSFKFQFDFYQCVAHTQQCVHNTHTCVLVSVIDIRTEK